MTTIKHDDPRFGSARARASRRGVMASVRGVGSAGRLLRAAGCVGALVLLASVGACASDGSGADQPGVSGGGASDARAQTVPIGNAGADRAAGASSRPAMPPTPGSPESVQAAAEALDRYYREQAERQAGASVPSPGASSASPGALSTSAGASGTPSASAPPARRPSVALPTRDLPAPSEPASPVAPVATDGPNAATASDANAASATPEATRPAALGPGATSGAPSGAASDANEPLDVREVRLAAELAKTLRARGELSQTPMREALALALLSGLDPAIRTQELGAKLSPDQVRAVDAARELARRLIDEENAQGAGVSLGSPGIPGAVGSAGVQPVRRGVEASGVARALAQAAERTRELESLRLSRVALASRVESFGRFEPLSAPGVAFVRDGTGDGGVGSVTGGAGGTWSIEAGRAQAALVYAEVEHFTSRPGEGSGDDTAANADEPARRPEPARAGADQQWTVELAQRVELFASDGTRVWQTPEQRVVDRSRTLRRDFFIVQRIVLPASLALGRYDLKVSVRDVASGAVAQASLAVRVVVDALETESPGAPASDRDAPARPVRRAVP
jgi:hypothetical protein